MSIRTQDWAGRSVFMTGHTGFKGPWLTLLLGELGATVHGYALDPIPGSLFDRVEGRIGCLESDVRADVCDIARVTRALRDSRAEVVIHMAAQSLVRDSYSRPVETFRTNVMGTLAVLEAVRAVDTVRSVVIVTTDKVYRNAEQLWGYREGDPLGGDDPYSASKACAELVSHSMARSFPRPGLLIATARAGNVLGGGDQARDGLLPDLLAAFSAGRKAVLRSPGSVRPWQHVLEPLTGYLALAAHLLAGEGGGSWNFGPAVEESVTVGEVATYAAGLWGDGAAWVHSGDHHPHEARLLALDSVLARHRLGWRPTLDTWSAIQWTLEWEQTTHSYTASAAPPTSPEEACQSQIARYLKLAGVTP